jgi:glycosyltransferase involved in cell wall biosynthesis
MKISIITACRNSDRTIKETIASVVNQSYKDIEYIIIDGKSEDNTLKVIDEFRGRISIIVSEKDGGVYDAMNKGIALATGDYLFFLNADDRFLHNKVVEQAVKAFSPTHPDVVYGDILYLNSEFGSVSLKRQNKINKIYMYKNMPCQPTVFYNKAVFKKCGKFRTDYKIVSDYAWMLNAIIKKNISLQYIGVALTLFSSGGMSSDRYDILHNQERTRVRNEYFSKYELMSFAFISRYLRTLTTIPFVSNVLNLFIRFNLKNNYIDLPK